MSVVWDNTSRLSLSIYLTKYATQVRTLLRVGDWSCLLLFNSGRNYGFRWWRMYTEYLRRKGGKRWKFCRKIDPSDFRPCGVLQPANWWWGADSKATKRRAAIGWMPGGGGDGGRGEETTLSARLGDPRKLKTRAQSRNCNMPVGRAAAHWRPKMASCHLIDKENGQLCLLARVKQWTQTSFGRLLFRRGGANSVGVAH